jgi:hypothetical protein
MAWKCRGGWSEKYIRMAMPKKVEIVGIASHAPKGSALIASIAEKSRSTANALRPACDPD